MPYMRNCWMPTLTYYSNPVQEAGDVLTRDFCITPRRHGQVTIPMLLNDLRFSTGRLSFIRYRVWVVTCQLFPIIRCIAQLHWICGAQWPTLGHSDMNWMSLN